MTEEYDPNWYEEEYFTSHPYRPYHVFGLPAPLTDARYRIVKSEFHPKSLLDVGCAYGLMVERCLKDGIPAMGLDISKFCEKQAAKIIPGHFVRGVAWKLPFKDKEFDLLYCAGVLEHIPEWLVGCVFSEFDRVAERRVLDISFDCSSTEHHLCNHDFEWWFDKCPPNTWLSLRSNTLEMGEFAVKTRSCLVAL